jgi:hypothetical protein
MKRLNKSEEGNIQSIHIAKLASAFQSACNSVNIMVSFRNIWISSRLEQAGIPGCYVDKEQCHCLLYLLEALTATGDVETEQNGNGLSHKTGGTEESSVSIRLRIPNERAAQLLGDNEE